MKISLSILIGVIVLLAIIFLFSGSTEINQLNPQEFENLISDENVFILQAHIPYQGEIEGTDLIMTDWENPQAYARELPEDKEQPIAVYCRSGRMSQITAEQLVEMGYKNIYNLEGGMNDWETSGRQLTFN